jgi:TolB protein
MWMPPAGDLMLGASRTVVAGTAREFEHLRIRVDAGKLVYIALPSGQRETSFPSTHASDTALVFENPAHDFPQRILYRKRGSDSLLARVEGPGPNNTVRGVDYPMRRADCTSIAPPPPPDTMLFDAELSPNGRELLVVKAVGPNWDLFLVNLEGTNARRLTEHPAVDYQPAWSPNGERIAFTSVRDGHQEIYSMKADGSDVVQLTRGTAHNSAPAWSPDGKTIAFASERDRPGRVYLMNADGSNQRPLTRDTAASASPAWAPNGTSLLFTSNRSGRNEVYRTASDGAVPPVQLTTTAQGHSGLAVWSPDGSKIAFWSSRDGNDEVYVMNADGSNVSNISRNPARDLFLGWTRDGAHILFRSTRDRAAFEIYRMRPDGSDVQRLTRTP